MSDVNLIKKQGWILSESGLKSIDTNSKNITKTLLDRDLREIGAGINDLHKGKFESIEHELVVLQILKIRNISAPKSNENSKTAPKLLKLQLTDGQNTYSAIEMEPTALTIETRPGTKISLKVKQLKYVNGQLLLTPKNMDVLGGYVESLVSKWEISRSLANQMKGNRSSTAPPFIPFGQKIQQNLPNDRSFKSLQQSKQKDGEDNSEFNAQRQDAIAEATKAGTRKVFGGGNKTLIDSNVQKIMDKGYSEEQATTALKYARNNVEKALGNLKKRDERQQQRANSNNDTRENSIRENKRGGKGNTSSDLPQAKPSSGVSLFDFLENKIPESTTAKQQNYSSNAQHERFENNISSSFRKHDKENSNKSQQYSQYSSSNEQKSSQNFKSSSYNTRGDYDYRHKDGSNRTPRERDSGTRDTKYSQHHYQTSSSSNYSSSKSNHHAANTSAGGRGGDSYSSSSYSKPSSHHHNQQQHSMMSQKPSSINNNGSSSYHNNHNMSGRNDTRNDGKSKYGQKQEYNGGRMNSNKDYNSYSSSSGANSHYNNNKPSRSNTAPNLHHHHQQQQQQSNEMYHQKQPPKTIVESMEKMSLKGNQQQSQQSYQSSSYPPLTSTSDVMPKQQQKPQQSFPKIQSNYPIAGFQSKEANEQAKNALKTKNIPSAQNWQQQQQQQQQLPQQQSAPPPPQVQTIHQVPVLKGPPPPFSQAQTGPPQQIHSLQPTPFHQHPVMHAMPQPVIAQNPPVFHATPITYSTPTIIMQSTVQPPPQMAHQHQQSLKVGDLCLAKYWEDGKYYNAKITNVSESTYVVLYTDYGNAEEVRKSDCVPVPLIVPTQAPTPPQLTNFVQPGPTVQYGQQQKMSQPPQQHSYHSQSHSMPYKGGKPRRN